MIENYWKRKTPKLNSVGELMDAYIERRISTKEYMEQIQEHIKDFWA
jgi:hypothetical protein